MPTAQSQPQRSASRPSLGLLPALVLLAAIASAPRAQAQGCVAVRLEAPGVGALPSCQGQGHGTKWELSTSWRYFRSDKHFRGSHYERNRTTEGSEVINTVNQVELAVRYNVGPRWNLTLAVPYLNADRSSPLRNSSREVVGRTLTHSSGIGDMTFVARRWMLDPGKHSGGNFSLGAGLKLPTGDSNAQDTRVRATDANADGELSADEFTRSIENVDQSIQPGDGGYGVLFDLQAYQSWAQGKVNFYASLAYLANPEGTDKVLTHRNNPNEKYMSISDQYVARLGVTFANAHWKGWSAGIGGRVEGVPVHDLFGSDRWFRRPGYAVSIEPSVSWSNGRHAVGFTLPYAIDRNRQRSVPDLLTGDGAHGDAAFADWSAIVSYTHRFGGRKAAAMGHDEMETY